MKNVFTGVLITGCILSALEASACSFNCKTDLTVPETAILLSMDSKFKPTHSTFYKKDGYIGPSIEQNNVAFTNSVMTGTIDGEVVYRFQNKFGYNASKKHDIEDSLNYSLGRSEFKLKDSSAFKPGQKFTVKYDFYVPKEIKFSGNRTLYVGQFKNHKAGRIVWGIQKASAKNAVGYFEGRWRSSPFTDKEVKPHDLVFSYRGILGHNGNDSMEHITLARAEEWQGKWHTVEYTSDTKDNGSFKFVFNGKTIIDCTNCDTFYNAKEFYEEWANKNHKKDAMMFQWGVYQFAHNPSTLKKEEIVDGITYYKNIKIQVDK